MALLFYQNIHIPHATISLFITKCIVFFVSTSVKWKWKLYISTVTETCNLTNQLCT